MITYKANTCYCPFNNWSVNRYDGGWFAPVNEHKDTVIEYTLDKLDHSLLFQINYQNPIVSRILKNGPFRASNGITIDISNSPEARMSEWTIFVRGASSRYDTIPDITTFTHNYKRDNAYKAVRLAMKEFGAAVRKNAGFSFGYSPSNRGNVSPRSNTMTCICF